MEIKLKSFFYLASGFCLILKGIFLSEVNDQDLVSLVLTVLFLPSFLLSIISTLDLTNKKSLSILISHPYLVLLPTFTYFSFSKIQCRGDRRIAFSPKMSLVNMLLNAVCVPVIFIIWRTVQRGFKLGMLWIFFPFTHFPALFTLLFLYLDKISCCSCCGSAGRLVRVFDPDLPHKTFILEEGKVVELTDKDLEQGLEEQTEEETKGETEETVSVVEIEDRRDRAEADDDPVLETENSPEEAEKKEEDGEADSLGNTDVILDVAEETEEEEEKEDEKEEMGEADSVGNTDVILDVAGDTKEQEKKTEENKKD